MGLKTPDQEIEELISAQEPWLQRYLRGDFPASEDGDYPKFLKAYANGWAKADHLVKKIQEIIRRIPKEQRRSLRGHVWNWILDNTPLPPRGRPRKDSEGQEAEKLQAQGDSWAEVASKQGKTREAARKLVDSVRKRSRGK